MKIFKKILCTFLVVVLCLTSAPLHGFVDIEWPKLSKFNVSGWFDMVSTAESNTGMDFEYDTAEYLIYSNFSISGYYICENFKPENIKYKIEGVEGGLVLSGSMSSAPTLEPNKYIISFPFTSNKVGEYHITIYDTLTKAEDKVTVFITAKDINSYLASEIVDRKTILKTNNICLYKPDMSWTFNNMVYSVVEDVIGIELSSTQVFEIVLVRVLLEKLNNENSVEQQYAKVVSDIADCINGAIAISEKITKDTKVNSMSNTIKQYINDFYKIDVFDTLSSLITGVTTLKEVAQMASFYKSVSESISCEQLNSMFKPIISQMAERTDSNYILLSQAWSSLTDAINNSNLKISSYIAGCAGTYGLTTFIQLISDITVALSANALNLLCPMLGTVISVGMTVVSFCKTLDSILSGKLDGIERQLGVVNMLGNLYIEALKNYSSSFKKNSSAEYASLVVESYNFLMATARVAVNIQQENLQLLQKELLNEIYMPKFSLVELIERIVMLDSDDPLTSHNLIVERYPYLLEYGSDLLDKESEFLLKTNEDYLYYTFGTDIYKYVSLWDIKTRYTIYFSQNYSNDSVDNFQFIEFVYEGEKVDSRIRPQNRPGYQFVGWYTDVECQYEYDFSLQVQSDLVLFAKWEQIIETETIHDADGRIVKVNPPIKSYSLTTNVKSTTHLYEVSSQVDVIIPIYVDGLIIKEIAPYAIPMGIRSVFIPESVEKITSNAIPSNIIIYCEKNTYAEKYAKENDYNYIISNDGEPLESGVLGALQYDIVNNEAVIVSCDKNFEGTISIPNQIGCYDVTTIVRSAFENCVGLTKIVLPENIESIGNYAFSNCVNLKEIYYNSINVNLTEDSGCLFKNAGTESDGIKVIFGNKVKIIPVNLFWSGLYIDEYIRYYTPPKIISVVVGKSVESIGDGAFAMCDKIENLTFLGNNLTLIDEEAFAGCSSLKEVQLPNSLKELHWRSFSGCSSLNKVRIPGSVSSIGSGCFANCTNLTNVYISDLSKWCCIDFGDNPLSYGGKLYLNGEVVENLVIPDTVTSINDSAFDGYKYLKSLTIPDNVNTIGEAAFANCSNLTEITLGNNLVNIGERAFSNCSINNMNIPDSVTVIGNDAFDNCPLETVIMGAGLESIPETLINRKTLTKFVIGSQVTQINDKTFYWCSLLADIEIPNSVTHIGSDAFNNCESLESIIIPNGVTNIGESAFFSCDSLKSITIPNSVINIDRWAFDGCLLETVVMGSGLDYIPETLINSKTLKSFVIGSNVTEINQAAFYNCTLLKNIEIPNGVTYIDESAFYNCESLETITIPNGVTNIGEDAFWSCDSLKSIIIPDSVTDIGENAFYQCPLETVVMGNGLDYIPNTLINEETLKTFVIGSSVTEIGQDTFLYCSALTNVEIPNSVTHIGSGAFYYCPIETIKIPNSVTFIGEEAFYNCDNLETVTIANSVTSIEESAFKNCKRLSLVNYEGTEGEWFQINIDSYNDDLLNAKINFLCFCEHPSTSFVASKKVSCFEDGYTEGLLCTICNRYTSGHEIIKSPLSHTDNNGDRVCDICVEQIKNIIKSGDCGNEGDNIRFVLFDDGELIISGIGEMKDFIPEWDEDGISYDPQIPYGTFVLDDEYLYDNTVKKATIKEGVTSISYNAFDSFEALESVALPNSIIKIGDNAFSSCSNLSSIMIPDNVTSIGEHAFSNCKSLTEITLPKSVMNIEDEAFFNCDNIENIYIPESVKKIGHNILVSCDNLSDIYVDEDNDLYSSCDGVLLNKDRTILIQYPKGNKQSTYSIPSTVETIFEGAFYDCDNLINISIPNSVTAIGEDAFYSCGNLEKIVLPDSVTKLDYGTFAYCEKLNSVSLSKSIKWIGHSAFRSDKIKDVYYEGSEKEWQQISFEHEKWGDARIHFNATENNHFSSSMVTQQTCAKQGNLLYECICGHNYTVMLEPLGHIDENDDYTCDRCNVLLYVEHEITAFGEYGSDGDDVFWTLYEDGTIVITGSGKMYDRELDWDGPPDYSPEILGYDIKRIVVDNGITSIGTMAFIYFDEVEDVFIANTVERIGPFAFKGCNTISSIIIPENVTVIDESAFDLCEQLTDVYFRGTREQWDKIEIGANNEPLLNAKIHFNETNHHHIPVFQTINSTCVSDGENYFICSECELIIGEIEILKSIGHKSSYWIVIQEATQFAEGKKVKKCTVCSEVLEEALIPKSAVVSDDGIEMVYKPDDYDGEVKLHVEESFDGSAFNLIDTQTGATQSFIYDIKMTVDGKEVRPVGNVTIRIPLPNGFKADACYIYYVNTATGKVERIETTYENGYLVFETNHFSYYAIVDVHEHTFDDKGENCKDCGFDRTEGCGCNCHKGGIMGLFFKIILFFQKIFRTNKECKCGIAHY